MTRVLIVEDSPTQAAELRMVLESAGYGVQGAPNGERAVEAMRASRFDLVISDIVMPGLSGYEVSRWVKTESKWRETPVVLLTTLSDPMDIIQGLESGADNFITKPYDPEHLLERIGTLLENRRLRTVGKLKLGVELLFLGKKFTITSDKEQILDLLITTFEDIVRTNQRLLEKQDELTRAKAQIEAYARRLEGDVSAAEEKLRRAQKLEAIGRLAGGVAHDFNNLLTVMTGYSDMILRRIPAEDASYRDLREVRKAADRASGLTRQLLAFSRKQVLQAVPLDLNETVTDVERMLRRLIGEDVELVTRLGSGLGRVLADPGQIEQVIMNLAVNARDAMPRGGRIEIETTETVLEGSTGCEASPSCHGARLTPGPHVRLSIRDTGCGMSEEVQAHLFEPFYTTKEAGKGTGLGLSTVYGIVHQSGGCIEVESAPGKGSTFHVYLPRTTAQVTPRAKPRTEAPAAGGGETILLAEDEDLVRDVTRQMLELAGYRVITAKNGREALQTCEQYPEPIHMLVTDVMMPSVNGPDLAERVQAIRPGIGVLFLSGYSSTFGDLSFPTPGTNFLQKPFTANALAQKVREVLDAAR